eukprot:CAMPEP_0179455722 /NCGR_PEP_ID=MMETSP0799-20121207/39608_1 /TAXON_ID=46947 /ORGANISM="Geminigera cryophila, Strain CCMP2564" /LENGTH=66 /DNA_ID=CAMNT_0021254929 /DNA_START=461 /DNA_END=661 /DNA_ORIENTATION=+
MGVIAKSTINRMGPVNLTTTNAIAKAPAEGSMCEAMVSGSIPRNFVMSMDLIASHVATSDPAQMVE